MPETVEECVDICHDLPFTMAPQSDQRAPVLGDYNAEGWEKQLPEGLGHIYSENPELRKKSHLEPMPDGRGLIPTPDWGRRWKDFGEVVEPEAWADDGQMDFADQCQTGLQEYQQTPYTGTRPMPKQEDSDYVNLQYRQRKERNKNFPRDELAKIYTAKLGETPAHQAQPNNARPERARLREDERRHIRHMFQGKIGSTRSRSVARP